MEEAKNEDGDSLIIYPPKEVVDEMRVGDEVGFNCQGKHWIITRDE